MATPGRSLDPIWDYFKRDTTTNPKVPKAICRGCSLAIGAIVPRMTKHVKACTKARALFPLRSFTESKPEEEQLPQAPKRQLEGSSEPPKSKQFRTVPLSFGGAPFSESLFENLVEPVVWWQAGNRLGFPSRLADFAVRVLSIVPSTAGLERLFSTLRLTYGLLRTNLGVEKAGKVGFLFRALRKS